jgi:hypothetical protein
MSDGWNKASNCVATLRTDEPHTFVEIECGDGKYSVKIFHSVDKDLLLRGTELRLGEGDLRRILGKIEKDKEGKDEPF